MFKYMVVVSFADGSSKTNVFSTAWGRDRWIGKCYRENRVTRVTHVRAAL